MKAEPFSPVFYGVLHFKKHGFLQKYTIFIISPDLFTTGIPWLSAS
jgi:hypothetical protein